MFTKKKRIIQNSLFKNISNT